MNKSKLFKRYLLLCFLSAAFICAAQVISNTVIILASILVFMAIAAMSSMHGFAVPVLLFFLPWSPIIRTGPGVSSFYTIALVLICVICFVKTNLKLNVRCFSCAIIVLFVTLVSKLFDGSSIELSYIMFIFLLLLLPNVTGELFKDMDFNTLTIFFSIGIITAALSAQQLASIPTIAQYIEVFSWSIIVRHCGYYGDANFYAAHITAAFAGVLILVLTNNKKKYTFWYFVLALILLYCGFISASKAFAITIALVTVLWFFAVLGMRNRPGFKIYVIVAAIITVLLVFTTGIFTRFIDIVAFRLGQAQNAHDFTTGRTERWADYIKEILSNPKVMLLGKGFNNVKINDLASHSTPLQIIYQLGIIGGGVLVAWLTSFVKILISKVRRNGKLIYILIMLVGIFLPWFALDMLFFDEFFLLIIYMCTAITYFSETKTEPVIDGGENATSDSK